MPGPWDDLTKEWAREGLVTPGQAAAIAKHQTQLADRPGPVPTQPTPPWVAEGLQFTGAAVLPIVFAFLVANAIFASADDVAPSQTEGKEDVVGILLTTAAGALAVFGYLRRERRMGSLGLVAGAALWAGLGLAHPDPTWWMLLPGVLLLWSGLLLDQRPAGRVANTVLVPLVTIGLLDALPGTQDTTWVFAATGLHFLVSWLLTPPGSRARVTLVAGLLVLAGAAAVLGLYFLAVAPTWQRAVFALVACLAIAALFAMQRHPRLRGVVLRPLVA